MLGLGVIGDKDGFTACGPGSCPGLVGDDAIGLCSLEIGPFKNCSGQVGAGKISATKISTTKTGSLQIGTFKVGVRQISKIQFGAGQICAFKVCSGQIDPGQHHSGQITSGATVLLDQPVKIFLYAGSI